MTPGPCATIDLSALRHNLGIVKKLAPHSGVIPVIKADAYGHGMLPVARCLADLEILAVARIAEALALRQAGISQRILVLEGFFDRDEMLIASQNDLDVVIHQASQINLLEKAPGVPGKLRFWLKIDTGMHRLGVSPDEAGGCYQRLAALACCDSTPVLMTHLANADNTESPYTSAQLDAFKKIARLFDAEQSLANSAAVLAWPESHQHWVRPGIMLYGSSPMLGMTAAQHGLKPVMTLSSQLIAVKHLRKGDCVGYGSTWCCPEDMPVGVVAVGYGDGYPRHAPSGTPVLVNGQRAGLVGRVSMDMLTVDLRGIEADETDEVILWGPGLAAEEVAQAADTITYELFCGVTSRVRFAYRNEQIS